MAKCALRCAHIPLPSYSVIPPSDAVEHPSAHSLHRVRSLLVPEKEFIFA